MKIHVNGQVRESAAATVGGLLAEVGVDPARVAVELERAIVSRDAFDSTPLTAGDRVEIVRFVSGG